MKKFLLGVAVTVALYHRGEIKGFIHSITGEEFHIKLPSTAEMAAAAYHPKFKGEDPGIRTDTEVQEPTLDKMEELGFTVRRGPVEEM
jgi:hypothetical protein